VDRATIAALTDLFEHAPKTGAGAEKLDCQAVRGRPCPHGQGDAELPCWNPDSHELTLGGQIVKRFRQPAPDQERILAAFQESGWPERIDDPLPPHGDVVPKQCLHFTISNLNRCHDHSLVGFHGNGTGEGIRWARIAETVPAQDEAEAPRRIS
jgi:hypothetical protein